MDQGYLLDSHTLIWSVTASGRLGRNSRRVIARGRGLWFSLLSIAELRMKESGGKIKLTENFEDEIVNSGFLECSLDRQAISTLGRWKELLPRDPFDLLLVGQAFSRNLTLLTADRRLLASGLSFIQDAER